MELESEARLEVEELGGKREEQEQRKADNLSRGSESYLEDGASLPSLRQRSNYNTSFPRVAVARLNGSYVDTRIIYISIFYTRNMLSLRTSRYTCLRKVWVLPSIDSPIFGREYNSLKVKKYDTPQEYVDGHTNCTKVSKWKIRLIVMNENMF